MNLIGLVMQLNHVDTPSDVSGSMRMRRLSHDDFAAWVVGLNTALFRLEYAHYANGSRAGDVQMTQSDFGLAVIAALIAAGRQDVAEYEGRCVWQPIYRLSCHVTLTVLCTVQCACLA